MILFKNQEGQVVYTTITDLLTGLPVSDNSVEAFLSQDGGELVATSNAVTEVKDSGGNSYGLYAVSLTATETNCDAGAVVFTSTLLEASTDNIAAKYDTVYFQTSATTPTVTIADGNYNFSTSGSVGSVTGSVDSVTNSSTIVSSIKSATYDGVSQEKLFSIILSFIAGKATITAASSTTQSISYKKQDGTTEILKITVSTQDGARSSGGTIS